MLAPSPDPGVAAHWYHAINAAAAKLAIASGAAPAHVRSVSGLRRVEIKRSAASVRRQVIALAQAGVLAWIFHKTWRDTALS
jgi:hypothetical protein